MAISSTGITHVKSTPTYNGIGVNNWTSANTITPATTFKNSIGETVLELPANEATMKVNGKLILNDENIDERLKRIEDMLHIPHRNVIMEQKYDKLKKLWEEYNETLEAIKTWETIKESK